MKRHLLSAAVLLLGSVLVLGGCMTLASLWPSVDPPINSESSLLMVEAGEGVPSESGVLYNTNFTGWAPWVENEKGQIIPFKVFNDARLDTAYFAENLSPGIYTLKGFIHVYTDYGKLPEDAMPSYEPFEDNPYHVKQFFPVDYEVIIELEEDLVDTLGRYYISYDWIGGADADTDDRWKVNEDTVSIVSKPNDRRILRIAKNWATSNWKLWNEKNPETAADE